MKAHTFRTWLKQLPSLSFAQRKTLLQMLVSPQDEPGVQALVNQRSAEVLCCPSCQAQHIHRWGIPLLCVPENLQRLDRDSRRPSEAS